MKNFSSKNGWMTGTTQAHVETPPTPILKKLHNGKSDKEFLKLKLRRYPTSFTSDICELKMSLFDNGEPKEFLLFVRNFNMTLVASGMMEAGTKFQYLHTLVRGEELRQFDSLSADVESTETLDVGYIIRDLAQ